MRGQIAQAANTHMMKIGSSVDCKEWWHEKCSSYEDSEHLYATTAKFSGCVLLDSHPAYSYPPRRDSKTGKVPGTRGLRKLDPVVLGGITITRI
ncbi:hypothetical protein AVEN_252715-1 [Araneus ventricosus]|uniref:Uncharacterized protein n=1 Tax=Araneus ventricosus TaxID=182803 RepID=A0A4Y2W1B8_ARAVE|nr:hypothetical protein AVEN_252715-1 [Araneus ventricosus]